MIGLVVGFAHPVFATIGGIALLLFLLGLMLKAMKAAFFFVVVAVIALIVFFVG